MLALEEFKPQKSLQAMISAHFYQVLERGADLEIEFQVLSLQFCLPEDQELELLVDINKSLI